MVHDHGNEEEIVYLPEDRGSQIFANRFKTYQALCRYVVKQMMNIYMRYQEKTKEQTGNSLQKPGQDALVRQFGIHSIPLGKNGFEYSIIEM